MRTRVKICGITTVEDAWAAIDAGADALGFVFFEKSARAVSIQTASAICQQLPAFITRVALFVDASVETVKKIAKELEEVDRREVGHQEWKELYSGKEGDRRKIFA